jgi:hypothetical protein
MLDELHQNSLMDIAAAYDIPIPTYDARLWEKPFHFLHHSLGSGTEITNAGLSTSRTRTWTGHPTVAMMTKQ